jgi:hypothetical protein
MNQSEQGKVVLLVYSGQADPEWPLDRDLEAKIQQAIQSGTDGPSAEPGLPSVLGYKGFRVELPTFAGPGATVTVGGGVVTVVQPDGAPRAWRDKDGLESALLEDAVEHGHGGLLDELGVAQGQTGPRGAGA